MILIISVVLLALTGTVQARVGGGQRYGGARGGDNGGEGLGIVVYLLLRLCVEQPCIGVPLTIAVIVGLFLHRKHRRKVQEATIARSATARRQSMAARGDADLEAIRSSDPGFTEEEFREMVKTAFVALQNAWSNQDMTPVKAYVSDGVLERFGLQLDMQRAMGYRNSMKEIRVLGVRIVSAHTDSRFHTIHAEIHARADDTDVDLKSGRTLRVNTGEDFIEYWTFLRKPGAGTPAGGGLVGGFCPNCGASLALTDAGTCGYCGAHITSGAFDWILTGITQEAEWLPERPSEQIPGYSEIVDKDPGFNIQPLQDTAAVVFWRYVKSYFDGSPAPMAKVAHPLFIPTLERNLRQTADGEWRLYFHDAAVGSVAILDIEPGNEFDRARLLIKWSAWNRYRNSDGRVRGAGDRSIRPQVFTLLRRSDTKTLVEKDFHSAHCPGCAAPYTGGPSGQCDYCGKPLNDGSGAWVLDSITAFSADMLRASSAGAGTVNPEMVLWAMAATMFADGKADAAQKGLLESFSAARGVSAGKVAQMVAAAESGEPLPKPENPVQARAVLEEMVGMALSDGTICASEMKFLESFAVSAGLSGADLRTVIAGKRKTLYREAKREISG
jgi:ribosomal protein L24E